MDNITEKFVIVSQDYLSLHKLALYS